jgi:hypothetical protein
MRIVKILATATSACVVIPALCVFAFLADGWWEQYKAATPNTSLAELNEMVYVGIPAKSVRWQAFGTPEYLGGVPGPTDYITLVAELAPADKAWFDKVARTPGQVVVMPEAARRWLSPGFRAMLAKHAGRAPDIASMPACRRHSAAITRSGRVVDGFVCWSPESSLLYLTLSDMTGQDGNAN